MFRLILTMVNAYHKERQRAEMDNEDCADERTVPINRKRKREERILATEAEFALENLERGIKGPRRRMPIERHNMMRTDLPGFTTMTLPPRNPLNKKHKTSYDHTAPLHILSSAADAYAGTATQKNAENATVCVPQSVWRWMVNHVAGKM